MKLRLLSPFFFMSVMIISVSIACNLSPAVPPTQPPVVPTQVVPPTQASVIPTQVVPTTNNPPAFPTQSNKNLPTHVPPTLAPLPTQTRELQSGDMVYSTIFKDLSEWKLQTRYDLSNYIIENRADGLFITIPSANDHAYLYYDLGRGDVRMEADVELIGGTNYTYIILACRASDKGEYTFTLDMGGYWQIGKWDAVNSKYTRLKDGGSVNINVAKAKNHMTGICQGNSLTFKINGFPLGTATDSLLSEGEIGVEVITYDYAYSESAIHKLEVFIP